MRAVDIIASKRDGRALSLEEIRYFVDGVTAGTLPDYQASALLMAVVLRGMTAEETAWLTDAMVHSGVRVDLGDIPGVKVDKHSTGGVGDKTSLILAPLAAACGVPVPMMSGRGLGHTGGTLDKLEAIPGFRVNLSLEEMKAALARAGFAMIGPTAEIAPADRKLYALRDVTGTVESIPLISASIMSKKIAEGIDALVLDVKTGSGAFMKTEADSRRLAESLVTIGKASGVKTEAIITAMDAPLGCAVGNAMEVIECLEVLKGRGPNDLIDVSVELTARMLVLGRVADDLAAADEQARRAIASGAGLERFRRIIEIQGGDPRVVDDYDRLPHVDDRHLVSACRDGYVASIDAELVGRASVALGAGRDRVEDAVDPAVGIRVIAKPGDAVRAGDAVLELHYRDCVRLEAAIRLTNQAITIGDGRPARGPLIVGEVR
ncbi:MAG: thymidine phosphorylase [Acidobacteria bacterium]|nr:MAG: thymidine phosphorylase [Acidobacteriota bacterium]PYR54329.1 MAG: thymidine phosphorylase [Acidobacteriota bacterium]